MWTEISRVIRPNNYYWKLQRPLTTRPMLSQTSPRLIQTTTTTTTTRSLSKFARQNVHVRHKRNFQQQDVLEYSWKQQQRQLFSARTFSSGNKYSSWLRDSASKLTTSWRESTKAGQDTVRQTSQKVSERVQSKASQLAQTGTTAVRQTVDTVSSQAKSKASQWAKTGQDKVVQSTQRASSQVQTVSLHAQTTAQRLARQGHDQVSQSAQRASSQAKSLAATAAAAGQERFVDGLQSMRRDTMRWIWWWSLAAIAVYGIATTLPAELLRDYNRKRMAAGSSSSSPETTTTTTTTAGDTKSHSSGFPAMDFFTKRKDDEPPPTTTSAGDWSWRS